MQYVYNYYFTTAAVYRLIPLPFMFAGVFGHWISLQRYPRRPTVRAERATRWVRQVTERRNATAPTATAAGRQ